MRKACVLIWAFEAETGQDGCSDYQLSFEVRDEAGVQDLAEEGRSQASCQEWKQEALPFISATPQKEFSS